MAAPTLTTMMSNVRLYIQDTDTTVSASFTDAQLTTFINAALMWWYENNEKRVKRVTLIADWDLGVTQKDGDATCIYPEILQVEVSVGGVTNILEPKPWGDIAYRQNSGFFAETGGALFYAAIKYGAAGVGAAAQNLWRFALYPIPDVNNNVLTGLVRDYPVALSAGADICDVGDFEGKCIEIIASILAAPRMGRPELAEDLMGLLPKLIQDKLQTHRVRDEVNA